MRAWTLKSLTIFCIGNLETNQEDSHHPHQQFAGPRGRAFIENRPPLTPPPFPCKERSPEEIVLFFWILSKLPPPPSFGQNPKALFPQENVLNKQALWRTFATDSRFLFSKVPEIIPPIP